MSRCWVIGSHGLLGAALVRNLRAGGSQLFEPEGRFNWNDPKTLANQFGAAVAAFGECLSDSPSWEIYWAAGAGTFQSDATAMANENRMVLGLLEGLNAKPSLRRAQGAVALASSAGGIYAGCRDPIITEASAVAPNTAYAQAKLVQEQHLDAFARSHGRVVGLAARLSTLYGPGQASAKPQGLLTNMARNIVRGRAVQIFVPLDTVRDYITSDDAARDIVSALRGLPADPESTVRIVAGETPVTISEIVATFRRVSPRPPLVITGSHVLSALYPRSIRFRSNGRHVALRPQRTSLAIGIARLLEGERMAYVSGCARHGSHTPAPGKQP